MKRELACFVEQARAKVRAKEVQDSGSNDSSKQSETAVGDTGAKEGRQAPVRYHG